MDVMWRSATLTRWEQHKYSGWSWFAALSKKWRRNVGLKKYWTLLPLGSLAVKDLSIF